MIEQKQRALTHISPENCPRCGSNKTVIAKTYELTSRFDLLGLLCINCDNDFYGVIWKFYDRLLINPWSKCEN